MKLTPAEWVIRVFGNAAIVGRHIGRSRAAVAKWRAPRIRGGCDGFIPRLAGYKILDAARKYRLDITPEDLLVGREVK